MSREQNPLHQGPSVVPAKSGGVFAGVDSIHLTSAPINPAWVLSGHPRARAGAHSLSGDDGASTSVWDCTAGAFSWYYGWDETVLILEGSVKVTSAAGRTTELNVGDVGYFAAGTSWKWEVGTYVRKLAFCRRPASRPERLLLSARRTVSEHWTAIRISIGIAVAATAVLWATN